MSVFTIFFCGTGSNSFDFANKDYHSGELVSTLARNAGGMEFVNWIIGDGPGSGNYQEDEKFVQPGYYSGATGTGLGYGWVENVAHAMSMIRGRAEWSREELTDLNYRVLKQAGIPIEDMELEPNFTITMPKRKVTQQALQMQKIKIFRRGNPVTQVNVIGWSRGAVTTHMFANAMASDRELRLLPLNIIAIDPVPGPGNFQSNRTTIPSNVRNYLAFFARDERSLGFAATLPKLAPEVSGTIIPMPGRHATLVGNAGNYIGGNGLNVFASPGRVVRMLVEKHLTDWGTDLTSRMPYSELQMLLWYDNMVELQDKFVALRKTVYTTQRGQTTDRDIGVGTDWFSTKFNSVEQLKPDGLFVNWHHRALFKKHFHSAYFYIFGSNRKPGRMNVNNPKFAVPHTWRILTHFKSTGRRIGPT